MKRLYIYIIMCGLFLTACQQDIPEVRTGKAELQLDLLRAGRPVIATRGVDEGLAVRVLKDGAEYVSYHAGQVPNPIVLEPGTFTIQAYSENQDGAWKTENDGKGTPCYFAETTVEMEYDAVTRLTLDVPMTNYAVGLKLPDLWDSLFRSYTFRLKSGSRTVVIKQGERAYFDTADGGFSYSLSATNTDGRTSSHSAINFTDIAAGKLFTLCYHYDSDANSGGIDIVITDDMQTNDNPINL